MPFATYASPAEVARSHRVPFRVREFITPLAAQVSDHFRAELTFTLSEVPYRGSEYAACETLIYPFLREVWKPYHETLTLWSHQPIAYDEDLCGVPDYLVARRSPLGALVLDLPYLLVAEAKKDDFDRGWGQCLAAMLAAQKLNDRQDVTLYGIATNGRFWELGRLDAEAFTQDPRSFSLNELDTLAGAVNFVLVRCRDQALALRE
jgi:hypothetical protein